MQYINKRIEEIGGTDIKYKEIKNTVITEITYKVKGKKLKLSIDGAELGKTILPIKEKYMPIFREHQEKIDKKIAEMNEIIKPKADEYKKEIETATNDVLKQILDKQMI